MAGWRYLLQRHTGSGWGDIIHTDLPLQNVSVTSNLTATDELTAEVSPALGSMRDSAGRPIFDEWGTAIWAELDDQIVGGGIVVNSTAVGPKWSLRCIGLAGYPYGLPYTGSWFGVGVDPLDVFRKVWTDIQAEPGGNLEVVVDPLLSGLKIGVELKQVDFDTQNGPVSFEAGPIKLNWYETHDLGTFVSNLADETPFEYRERHAWNSAGTGLTHRIELGYPRLGRRITDMRFVYGENIFETPSIERDGSQYASDILVLGAGSGRTMIKGQAHQATGKIRRVLVDEQKQIKSLGSANGWAMARLKKALILDTVSSVTVRDSALASVSGIQPGDEFFLQTDSDWNEDLAFWVRVESKTLSPDASDDAVLSIVRSDQVS